MTTPDAKLPKALWLDKTRFEHRMKTDPDADKLRAALPEQIKVSLDRSERFEPVTPYLVYAIAERLDMEKEAGRKWPFYAGWHEAHQCVKAAKEFVNTYNYTQTVDAHGEQLATTLDNNFYKALGMIEPGSVELLMKTEPDVDKVLAALPEIDQKVVAGLKKYDQFDPALIYAIKAIVDKQKETRNFCAGWSATQERAKAAKKIVDKINFAQTVASTALTVDTHGVRLDGLDEHVAEQKTINAEQNTFKEEQEKTNGFLQKEVDACVDGHKTTQRDVKEQRRAMDKVKHTVEGAIGEQSRMAETLENELMGQRKERKELQGKTVEKAEAAAGLQQEVKMLAQLNDDNCKRLAASDEANRVLTAQNAELKAQLVLAKDSGEQAAKHAEKDQVRERKFQEREKDLLAQTRRESHGRHEKEKEQIVSRHAEERKALDDRLVAEGRKVAAVEAERDALTSKVKESDARVRAADERAATLDAKREELAAKLKDALAAEARASTELEKAKIALRQAHDQQSKVSGAADEVRGRCVKLEADLVAARAELKALARRPRAAFSPDPLKSQS